MGLRDLGISDRGSLAEHIRNTLTEIPSVGRYGLPGDMPHYSLREIYRNADTRDRDDFEYIVVECLREAAEDAESWDGAPLRELFMLAEATLRTSNLREEAIDLIHIVSHGLQAGEAHRTSLQVLLSLGFQADERYWLQVLEHGGSPYAGVVLDALSRISLDAFLMALPALTWDERTRDALFGVLPSVIDDHTPRRAVPEVVRTLINLPFDSSEISDWLQEMYPTAASAAGPNEPMDWLRVLSSVLHGEVSLAHYNGDAEKYVRYLISLSKSPAQAELSLHNALSYLLHGWDPWGIHQGPYSIYLLQIIRRYHSVDALIATTAFFEELLFRQLDSTGPQEFTNYATLCLSAIAAMPSLVRSLAVEGAPAYSDELQSKVFRSLRQALTHPDLRIRALEQLICHSPVEELPDLLAAALKRRWFSVPECLHALRLYYDAAIVDRIMTRSILLGCSGADAQSASDFAPYLPSLATSADTESLESLLILEDEAGPQQLLTFAALEDEGQKDLMEW